MFQEPRATSTGALVRTYRTSGLVHFSGSTLRKAWLVKANLDSAVFGAGCDLTGAHFDGAYLGYATFVDAKYPGATFEDVELDEIIWTKIDAQNLRVKDKIEIDTLSESRRGWTDDDWAEHRRIREEWERALADRRPIGDVENIKYWRGKRNPSSSHDPQP